MYAGKWVRLKSRWGQETGGNFASEHGSHKYAVVESIQLLMT